jgi:hypothetical protein
MTLGSMPGMCVGVERPAGRPPLTGRPPLVGQPASAYCGAGGQG